MDTKTKTIIQAQIDKLFSDTIEKARLEFPGFEILAFRKTTCNIKLAKYFCKTRDACIVRHKHYLILACDNLDALEAPIAIDIPIQSSD